MSLYEMLPIELLAGFYFEIEKNIKNGIFSENMYNELRLIEKAVINRGITRKELNEIYNTITKKLVDKTITLENKN